MLCRIKELYDAGLAFPRMTLANAGRPHRMPVIPLKNQPQPASADSNYGHPTLYRQPPN